MFVPFLLTEKIIMKNATLLLLVIAALFAVVAYANRCQDGSGDYGCSDPSHCTVCWDDVDDDYCDCPNCADEHGWTCETCAGGCHGCMQGVYCYPSGDQNITRAKLKQKKVRGEY